MSSRDDSSLCFPFLDFFLVILSLLSFPLLSSLLSLSVCGRGGMYDWTKGKVELDGVTKAPILRKRKNVTIKIWVNNLE